MPTEAGILHHHRAPGGEIATASVAEPAALPERTDRSHGRELASRSVYIPAIRVRVPDPLAGGHDPPPFGAQRRQLGIRVVDRQAHLDRHRDSAGEVDHGLEGLRLLRIPHALPLDPAVVAPVGHCRKSRSGRVFGRPFGQHDRPQGLFPANSAGRKRAARLAQIQADREIEVVSPQPHVDAVLLLPNLGMARIQIEVHAAANATENGCVCAELVEEEVHIRADLVDVLAGEADVGRGAGLQQRGSITQLEAVDQPPEGLRVGALRERRRLEVFVHEVPWLVLLDVIDVAPETPEAEDPLQKRPGIAAVADSVTGHGTREENTLCQRRLRSGLSFRRASSQMGRQVRPDEREVLLAPRKGRRRCEAGRARDRTPRPSACTNSRPTRCPRIPAIAEYAVPASGAAAYSSRTTDIEGREPERPEPEHILEKGPGIAAMAHRMAAKRSRDEHSIRHAAPFVL